MLVTLALAALIQTTPAIAGMSGDPLAPAAAGQILCYKPDTAQKTCHSIAEYAAQGNGGFTSKATILVSKSPLVILRSATPVHEEGGAVCGIITADQLSASTLVVNGNEMSADEAAPLLALGVSALDKIIGKNICTSYSDGNDGLQATATVDGQSRPDLTQTVMWVSPSDGYRVAP